MKLPWFSQGRKVINIVFTDYALRVVEAKTTPPFAVTRWTERELPPETIKGGIIYDSQTLLFILEEIVADWGLKHRPVQFLVPDQYAIVRRLSIPKDVKEDELHSYIFLEIGTSIHLPFENPAFDVIPLGEKEKKQEALLFASREDIVASYANLLEEAKLKPLTADMSILALYRLFLYSKVIDGNGHYMMLQLDRHLLTVSIFHGYQPVFMRPIPVEWNQVEEKEVNHWSLPLEDLYNEIERVINFYRYSLFHGDVDITCFLLSGDYPVLDVFGEALKERWGKEVFKVPEQHFMDRDNEPIPSSMELAIGLALKEVLK
ncbi:MAG: pilus assembly protein PilM [Bacillus sp. (in: Bacteria)]|nr:pilus assembly protein PilM [Bacillus sp. (in: firmicutes)]